MSTPAERVLELLAGKCRAQAVSTVASLGVADRLAAGPRNAVELASEIGCDAAVLERLLQFTAGLGLFARDPAGVYSLTPSGAELRADALGPLAAYIGAAEQWNPWSALRSAMRSGSASTPFEQSFGTDYYGFLAANPEAAQVYDLAIDAFTRAEARRLSEVYDLSRARKLLDVGGGRGTLLIELLARWPELAGTLHDRPDVVERVRSTLPPELAPRIELVGGDFHEHVPGGHDHVVLKHVLHNWDDERAARLLARCAESLPEGGRVLVIELILAPESGHDLARLLDLEMAVLTGGRVRRKPELRRLFQRAGLALLRTERLGSSWLLVGERSSVDSGP